MVIRKHANRLAAVNGAGQPSPLHTCIHTYIHTYIHTHTYTLHQGLNKGLHKGFHKGLHNGPHNGQGTSQGTSQGASKGTSRMISPRDKKRPSQQHKNHQFVLHSCIQEYMQTYIQTYRQDELTIHSIMSVHECARRANKLAKLANKLDSNIGQHHGPAALSSTINTTCQQHSTAPVVSTADRHHWPGPFGSMFKTRR